jgi:hypothetical protein
MRSEEGVRKWVMEYEYKGKEKSSFFLSRGSTQSTKNKHHQVTWYLQTTQLHFNNMLCLHCFKSIIFGFIIIVFFMIIIFFIPSCLCSEFSSRPRTRVDCNHPFGKAAWTLLSCRRHACSQISRCWGEWKLSDTHHIEIPKWGWLKKSAFGVLWEMKEEWKKIWNERDKVRNKWWKNKKKKAGRIKYQEVV